ncbi:uncharacterized protein N7529_008785 [Penicillium soppii]|uniref:uncharacterized protein n=1 Tax=Penicillium soppii TaxID=69789 RepID=UPI0025496519|nr:uncharacterized protein N7529_008785 [Penicillium soppii]KAJ5861475.1 hypothetical protein N7529_008785 [Penicillium soppii]
MTLPSRQSAQFLRRLVGTKFTTFSDFDPLQQPSDVSSPPAASPPAASPPAASPPPASFATDFLASALLTTASSATAPTLSTSGPPPPRIGRSWTITAKLSERAVHLVQEDVDKGVGSPMTVGRFLCHLEEDPTQVAFMRMYYQIPITGTEDADLTTLSQQIQPHEVCGELEAFKQLMSRGCSSVPRFLGYCEKMQGEYGLVPGGYVKYLVWEKVPGEPLTEEFFWSLGPLVREEIRAKFRVAYEEMLRCGIQPEQPRISKIIYDQSTGKVRISGFRMGWPICDTIQWSDTLYISYALAKPRDDRNWRSRLKDWEL